MRNKLYTGFTVMYASYSGDNACVRSKGSQKGTPNTSSIVLSTSLSVFLLHHYSDTECFHILINTFLQGVRL